MCFVGIGVAELLANRGIRSEAQKETEIGPIPESWELRTILELCAIWSGETPRKSVAEYWGGNILWVSGKDLKSPSLDDAIDHVTLEGVEAGSRLAPVGAVLLLVRGMGLAKDLPVAVINRPMAFGAGLRVSEVVALKVSDIDSKRMLLRDGNFGLVIAVARKGNADELRRHGAHLVVNGLSELVN